MTVLILVFFILILLAIFQLILSGLSYLSEPQFSTLESGFENLKLNSLVSVSFFQMAMLFVLFDLELILLFPSLTFSLFLFKKVKWLTSLWVFIFLTLLMEWSFWGLKWHI